MKRLELEIRRTRQISENGNSKASYVERGEPSPVAAMLFPPWSLFGESYQLGTAYREVPDYGNDFKFGFKALLYKISQSLKGTTSKIYESLPIHVKDELEAPSSNLQCNCQLHGNSHRGKFRAAMRDNNETVPQFLLCCQDFLNKFIDLRGLKCTFKNLVELLHVDNSYEQTTTLAPRSKWHK